MTHCDIISLLSECKPIEVSIQQQFCKFTANLFQYGSPVLRTIALIALTNPISVFGTNYNRIIGHGNTNYMQVRDKVNNMWWGSLSEDLLGRVNILRELLYTRSGSFISILSDDEIDELIYDICVL